jgi:nucleoside-diphosphate-sugar epimerase
VYASSSSVYGTATLEPPPPPPPGALSAGASSPRAGPWAGAGAGADRAGDGGEGPWAHAVAEGEARVGERALPNAYARSKAQMEQVVQRAADSTPGLTAVGARTGAARAEGRLKCFSHRGAGTVRRVAPLWIIATAQPTPARC